MALGPFVTYYPTNDQTEEQAKYGKPTAITPIVAAAGPSLVAVFNSHGAKAVVVEVTATTGLTSTWAALALNLMYEPDPARTLSPVNTSNPIVRQWDGTPPSTSAPSGFSVTQAIRGGTGVDYAIPNLYAVSGGGMYRYLPVYSDAAKAAVRATTTFNIKPVPADTRIALYLSALSDNVTALTVRIAFSDLEINDEPQIDASVRRGQAYENEAVVAYHTTVALHAAGTYSQIIDMLEYGSLAVRAYADQPSATGGLAFYWGSTLAMGVLVDGYLDESYTVPAAQSTAKMVTRKARYCKVLYTNGAVSQGTFDLVILKSPMDVNSVSTEKTLSELETRETVWAPGADSLGNSTGLPGAAVSLAADATAYAVNLGSYAYGSIACDLKANYHNNDYRTIGDGVHAVVTYEFQIDGTYVHTAGRTTVDISAGGVVTAQQVATVLQGVLAGLGAGTLNLTFGTPSAGVFSCANNVMGTAGNVAMGGGAAPAGHVVSGMSGGRQNYLKGGEGGYLICTKGDAMQDGTFWADFIVVKHGDPVPTGGQDSVWAGQKAYILAPGPSSLTYDVYAFRGYTGKASMYVRFALGQAQG